MLDSSVYNIVHPSNISSYSTENCPRSHFTVHPNAEFEFIIFSSLKYMTRKIFPQGLVITTHLPFTNITVVHQNQSIQFNGKYTKYTDDPTRSITWVAYPTITNI